MNPLLFIELPSFQRTALFDDEELRAIQETLCRDPEAGDLIQGGHGLRKLRARLSGQGK